MNMMPEFPQRRSLMGRCGWWWRRQQRWGRSCILRKGWKGYNVSPFMSFRSLFNLPTLSLSLSRCWGVSLSLILSGKSDEEGRIGDGFSQAVRKSGKEIGLIWMFLFCQRIWMVDSKPICTVLLDVSRLNQTLECCSKFVEDESPINK